MGKTQRDPSNLRTTHPSLADYLHEISIEKWEKGPDPCAGNILRYQRDPLAFFREVTGFRPHAYQSEITEMLIDAKRACVRSPRGGGKSALSANMVIWFTTCFDPCKVPTTAGSWQQLEEFLWPEIHLWCSRADWSLVGKKPVLNMLDMRFGGKDMEASTAKAFAINSDRPELLEGCHSDNVLYILDEAKAITNPIFDSIEGSLVRGNKYVAVFSTPGPPMGRFYDIQSRKTGFHDWAVRHIKHEELVAAGMVDPVWAENRRIQWGENSALYLNHVLGEFADTGDDFIIPLRWVEAAVERWKEWEASGFPDNTERFTFRAQGVDVAGQGKNQTSIAFRCGNAIRRMQYFPKLDTHQLNMHLLQFSHSWPEIKIEVDGMGAPVYEHLVQFVKDDASRYGNVNVTAIVSGSATDVTDRTGELRFADKRSQMWWHMRELLDPANGEDVMLPDDDLLKGDLVSPMWEIRTGGKVKVESKVDIKKRLGRSTDAADSVILAFADFNAPFVAETYKVSPFPNTDGGIQPNRLRPSFYDVSGPKPWPFSTR